MLLQWTRFFLYFLSCFFFVVVFFFFNSNFVIHVKKLPIILFSSKIDLLEEKIENNGATEIKVIIAVLSTYVTQHYAPVMEWCVQM